MKVYEFPDDVGIVLSTTPRLGVFVLPDNGTRGKLEDILLEWAQHAYPTLLSTATGRSSVRRISLGKR